MTAYRNLYYEHYRENESLNYWELEDRVFITLKTKRYNPFESTDFIATLHKLLIAIARYFIIIVLQTANLSIVRKSRNYHSSSRSGSIS